MNVITKPMLAGKCTDKNKIKYPVLATPKLDGIRCLVVNGQAVSRKFKPIPNWFIRETIEWEFPEGVDGEIMIPGKSFGEATGIIMSSKNVGPVDFQYWVFDYVKGLVDKPYYARMVNLEELECLPKTHHMIRVLPVAIHNKMELDAFEERCLSEGYEGIMIRDPDGPYKCGRSTEKEGYLLKIKRFEDSEAVITGFTEKFHNANEAKKDAFGRTERSSHQENMIPMNTLGNLLVKDVHNGVEFELGSGFDDVTRKMIWDNQQRYRGMIVKYKFQPYGVKDKPRFPVFLGFRSLDDMERE